MVNEVEKPIKFSIENGLCFEGEILKTFDNVLRFFNKKDAVKYVKKYYKRVHRK